MTRSDRILVTGATGFTGRHLCERLISEGYKVRGLVRDLAQCDALRQLDMELTRGDLRDADSLERAVEGVDIVYHIAGLFRPENVSRKDFWDVNVHGTRRLLDAAAQANVRRFVHCSTVGVYGDVKQTPAHENSPFEPGDNYQESKAEGENVAAEYMREGNLPIVIFRPAGIYGPHDLRFLKLFKAIQNGTFIMLGSGKVHYQMIYIADLVEGILLCGQKRDAEGQTYILTGDDSVTLNELVETVAVALGVTPRHLRLPVMPVYLAGILCEIACKPFGINPPLYRRRVDFFRKTRSFDISKAKRELAFQPRVTLREGLELTARWYREHGYLQGPKRLGEPLCK